AADRDPEATGLRFGPAAEDRGVEEIDSPRGVGAPLGPAGRGVDRGEIDRQGARANAPEDSALAEDDGFDRGRVGEAVEYEMGVRDGRRGGGRDGRAEGRVGGGPLR